MNFFDNILYKINKPKVIIISGDGRAAAKAVIFGIIEPHYKIGKDLFIFEYNPKEIDKMEFFIKNSSQTVFVATNVGEIPLDKDSFAGSKEKIAEIKKTVQSLPSDAFLAVNYDDETLKVLKGESKAKLLAFGLAEGVDVRASDITWGQEINFKINYKGSTVPAWISGEKGKEQIYAALAGVACGIALGLNLVVISQTLKTLIFKK
jgi:UDP-N-acetylmuramoyl-tripeptide--D-alanyl-D-alanine ligase